MFNTEALFGPQTASSHMPVVQIYRPTITTWNRLEGRTRAEDFDRAMRAEVRDALWMLSKQWQMGEFIGDDAGSPVLAKLHMETTTLNKYQAGGGAVVPFEQDVPLEAKVENQRIPFEQGALKIALDLRVLMGRQWLKWIVTVEPTLKAEYIRTYGIAAPDPTQKSDAKLCAHTKVWQQVSALAGRSMDGYRLYEYLKASPANSAYGELSVVPTNTQKHAIDLLAGKFIAWYERLYYQPHEHGNPSWKPEYLEHRFSVSAPRGGQEKVLVADEYYHGHLDWYNLDISPDSSGLGDTVSSVPVEDTENTITRTFIPTSVSFGGMPHPRWWSFEDWYTDLSFVKPDTPDLNKLMLLEFILIYSNDWFVVPLTLPAGSLANVRGLMVTNVFGEHTWVEAAGAGSDGDWQRWNMYTANVRGTDDVPGDTSLVLLPASRKVLEGKPLEEVFALRDEIANMVWGVESRVPLATGKSMPGKEAGYELSNKLQQLLDATNRRVADLPANAKIRYQVVNTVPEQWIPFLPVHLDENKRQIQLQRAAMPRILKGDPDVPKKIEPRTSLLREGLDGDGVRSYYIHEEEVPRAGIKIHKSFQRTRWYDGKVYTWLGIRKQVGKGGGSSGLAFDQIIPAEPGE